jgi:hypothetical protein
LSRSPSASSPLRKSQEMPPFSRYSGRPKTAPSSVVPGLSPTRA